MSKTAYDFSFKSIDGRPLPLSEFKGKALLVVNVASQCGLTPQYSGLEALWKEKSGKGLVVLGVPANDFGAQEPGTENEIKTFCETRFNVDFPMTAKEQSSGQTPTHFISGSRVSLATLRPRNGISQISVQQRRHDRRHIRFADGANGTRDYVGNRSSVEGLSSHPITSPLWGDRRGS